MNNKKMSYVLMLAVFLVAFSTAFHFAQKVDMLAYVGASSLGTPVLNQPTVLCENNIPKIALSWSVAQSATSYMIQRKEGSNVTSGWSSVIDSQIKQSSYIDTRWAASYGRGSYSYRIVAVLGSLRRYSNGITVTLPECVGVSTQSLPPPPPAPTPTPIVPPPAPVPVPVPPPAPVVPPPAPVPAPTPAPLSSTMKWGAYVGWQDNMMSDFEALVGKQPSMEMVFAHWGNDTFPGWYAPRIKDKGRTMVLFWEAIDYNRDYFSQPEYSFDSVLAGKQDAYFTKFAFDAKAYGGEVILVPYSEFNGNWYPWGGTIGGNTPEKYIAAWRYIHKFFETTPNVKFGWAPNADAVPDVAANKFELYYPGDAYVDYVGVDGFNSGVPSWMTFSQVFDNALNRLAVYNKPIYIFSVGVQADTRKAAWISDGFKTQLAKYPKVVGWLWFNENKKYNWVVNTDPASLAAFKSVLP